MLTHAVSDGASVTAAAQKRPKQNLLMRHVYMYLFIPIPIYTYDAHLEGISGREFRALASGTGISRLGKFVLRTIILPVLTFVWTIDNRLVRVVLQATVAVDEVHHVLCHRNGGNVDGEALQGGKEGVRLPPAPLLLLLLLCVPVWPPRRPGGGGPCRRSEANTELS